MDGVNIFNMKIHAVLEELHKNGLDRFRFPRGVSSMIAAYKHSDISHLWQADNQ
ncbi:hypothetical protein GJ744_012356 [Endocarpon pusillum]|uniref:Uncharacterized protein n=1 Tax=Endocarpon pusillum TaxID=364733 RepID=A0A8H7ADD6_9EURO|nr:hypothetical protein GJ744_012356 [Endocarpon pusillum]